MNTREAPDFWGLHKNMNCAFPLTSECEMRSKQANVVVMHAPNKT